MGLDEYRSEVKIRKTTFCLVNETKEDAMKKGYLLGEYHKGEIAFPYEIKETDVGKMLDAYFGDIHPTDVGKLLFMRRGIIQMENTEQMNKRKGERK